jgi:hypothetical protein
MPQPRNLAKAELHEIKWNPDDRSVIIPDKQHKLKVQFNPESMRVNFTNQRTGGDQRGGSSMQYVGKGVTKLSLDLWFDVTMPGIDNNVKHEGDVRNVTREMVLFMTPKEQSGEDENSFVPPGVRFIWGSFLFEGVIDSLDETLEYFSEDGIPLRAKVAVSISQQEIQFQFNQDLTAGRAPSQLQAPGTRPMQSALQGDSVQKAAGREGKARDWKAIAESNGIENPRRLEPGRIMDLNIKKPF